MLIIQSNYYYSNYYGKIENKKFLNLMKDCNLKKLFESCKTFGIEEVFKFLKFMIPKNTIENI